MTKDHAFLSASGAGRWMVCTPSARLEKTLKESESSYADEGTLAHHLCEHMIRHKAYGTGIKRILYKIQQHELYDEAMLGYAEEYADYVVAKVRAAPRGSIMLQEQRVNFHEYVPEGFGHLDVAIIGGDMLEVIDFKYGKGVQVDAYENKQMMLYALGMLEDYGLMYNIKQVIITIYQPRIDNISSYEISVDNLIIWGREVAKPTAIKAFQGEGEFIAGEHCRFCRARSVCKANATYQMQIAKREFMVPTIPDELVVKILQKADAFKSWLNALEERALKMALEGKQWPGMKLVHGRSQRRYTDEAKIMDGLTKAGYSLEDLIKQKLTGITDLTQKISKQDFKKHVEPYLIKPPGAPALVPEDDKRPAYNGYEAAALDFKPIT